jgi:hypothetical protein
MLPTNPAFAALTRLKRAQFISLLKRANVTDVVYPSLHFFERLVERNLDEVDALRMLTPVIHAFRQTTYNKKTFLIRWKQFGLVAMFSLGLVSGRRQVIVKTIYDSFDDNDYDEVIRI